MQVHHYISNLVVIVQVFSVVYLSNKQVSMTRISCINDKTVMKVHMEENKKFIGGEKKLHSDRIDC